MEKKQFNEGESVILRCTGEVKEIERVVRGSYFLYYLKGEEGYRISSDLMKIEK